jgi:hypothetical protein
VTESSLKAYVEEEPISHLFLVFFFIISYWWVRVSCIALSRGVLSRSSEARRFLSLLFLSFVCVWVRVFPLLRMAAVVVVFFFIRKKEKRWNSIYANDEGSLFSPSSVPHTPLLLLLFPMCVGRASVFSQVIEGEREGGGGGIFPPSSSCASTRFNLAAVLFLYSLLFFFFVVVGVLFLSCT